MKCAIQIPFFIGHLYHSDSNHHSIKIFTVLFFVYYNCYLSIKQLIFTQAMETEVASEAAPIPASVAPAPPLSAPLPVPPILVPSAIPITPSVTLQQSLPDQIPDQLPDVILGAEQWHNAVPPVSTSQKYLVD